VLMKVSAFKYLLVLGWVCLLCLQQPVLALENPGEELNEVGIFTNLGTEIDLSLTFLDSAGEQVSLADLFSSPSGREIPVVLVPAYYDCPRLCGLILEGVTELLNSLSLQLGVDYRVVTVSFRPEETPEHAKSIRQKFVRKLKDPELAEDRGWTYLVGDAEAVDQLMEQISFRYKPDGDDIAHAAAIVLLTPQGKVSQYFTGIQFPSWDVRLALVEASEGNIGRMLDQVLLFCFRFDPTKGRYTLFAINVMRAGGAVTLVLLIGLMWYLWRRDKRLAGKV
jgi:protein SCO1